LWFGVPNSATAPTKTSILKRFNYNNSDVSKTILKFLSHLWYLSDEALGFEFFDYNEPIDKKENG